MTLGAVLFGVGGTFVALSLFGKAPSVIWTIPTSDKFRTMRNTHFGTK